MPTLPQMGLITPTLGGDSGVWDDKINAMCSLIDSHYHADGGGTAVPVRGLDIDDNLPLGGYGLEDTGVIEFAATSPLTTGALDLFVSSADNELYWRTAAGVNVKLTAGTSINTTLVGGILGDYTAVGAALEYDDANKMYLLKQAPSPAGKWARLGTGPVRIYEFDTTETVYVELVVDAALAAPYTITLPIAPPTVTSVVSMSTTGEIVVGPRTITMSVSTSAWKRDDSIEAVAGDGFSQLTTAAWQAPDNTDPFTSVLFIPVSAPVGAVITGYDLRYKKATDATHSFTVILAKGAVGGAGAATTIHFDTISSNAPGETTLTVTGLSETIASVTPYGVEVRYTAGADPSLDLFLAFDFTYTTVV